MRKAPRRISRAGGIKAGPSSLANLLFAGICFTSCSQDKPAPDGGMGGASVTNVASSTSNVAVGPSSSSSGEPLPDVFTIAGIVTDGQNPIAGAIVMQGGGSPAFETGADGAFMIELTKAIPGTPTIVAGKVGYRSAGVELFSLPVENIEIVLRAVSPPDNVDGYAYGAPGVGDAKIDTTTNYCGHCHTTLVAQFQTSAHAKATRDPLVQDLYAGTSNANATTCAALGGIYRSGRIPGSIADAAPRCYLGGGVLPDLNGCGGPNDLSCDDPALSDLEKPIHFGHCADRHAAGLPGALGGRNLLDATGIAFENGNHCDVCHKVRDVDLNEPPGVAGRLLMQRPREKVTSDPGSKLRQVMFGPLVDVPLEFMGGSYQPKFSQAVFCAGCHEQQQEALVPGTSVDSIRFPMGLPTHSTYSEWSESGWAIAGTQCQHCHMPPMQGMVNSADTQSPEKSSIIYGFPRPPEQIRAHVFRGPLAGPNRLIDVGLEMWLDAKVLNGELSVEVKLVNQGAGHAFPTGEPMRSLLMVVQAEACGESLPPKGGLTLDDVGGAWAQGIVGQDIGIAGATWTWTSGAKVAKPGQVLRILRDTGQWVDYPGIGYFANPALGPADKGMPLRAPVGEARVVSVTNGTLNVDRAIAALPGDIVWLGDEVAGDFQDGGSSLALAGLAGQSFARVLVDAAGERHVPHYKAVNMASDNRLPPLEPVTTAHRFAIPLGCARVLVTATALYRPIPLHLGVLRGWEARDWIAATRKETAIVP